ncbi:MULTISPECIES: DUF2795 domain-containing protein [unclassified Streptomyces]|uniref:DUF2795 domain-containing protein n=1 Tax=unclassified Streptomyces TaxID=2593676 RepID=UPI0001C19E10|nr:MULTISPECIES: DUF2795 domain-containing protein [unclassified Streptomyces]AEN08258.1 conserved hypothetical protein [Streptomyces sp. SirexAA-E]MYR68241.1 DUF2795 domain-containing protein [Streptomyces sp. SID4939]MYS02579.1 DUF2795 domain-containing protein [Streptomyces sp. SID4940]MYT66596.1 DUF2795 domain-containing protein [Streptomyces sp. SID8357]MYT83517.1 DUF2795 domain-containing protein [Streptomyces sp. SID8360]
MTVNPIELQKALGGVGYPADKQQILDQAKQHGAGHDVIDALGALPDKSYDSPADVNKEVSQEGR